jgi:hypothetical protein
MENIQPQIQFVWDIQDFFFLLVRAEVGAFVFSSPVKKHKN